MPHSHYLTDVEHSVIRKHRALDDVKIGREHRIGFGLLLRLKKGTLAVFTEATLNRISMPVLMMPAAKAKLDHVARSTSRINSPPTFAYFGEVTICEEILQPGHSASNAARIFAIE